MTGGRLGEHDRDQTPVAPARALALVAAGAAGTAALAPLLLRPLVRRRPARWLRRNHAGRQVDLLAGPAAAAGLVAGTALAARVLPRPSGRPLLIPVVAAAVLGRYDDTVGARPALALHRGLRGHAAALRRGQLSTGAVKAAGTCAAALVGVVLAPATGSGRPRPAPALLRDAAVVALSAHLVNVTDLRPGRAVKVVVVLAGPLAARGDTWAAVAAGAAVGAAPPDLAGRSMLGDTGAGALGAALGAAVVTALRPVGRWTALAGLVAAAGAAERRSLSEVVARSPVLSALDAAGTRR